MSSTEEQVKDVILKYGSNVRRQQIARELLLSSDYTELVCKSLERKGEIISSASGYSLVSGRKEVSKKSVRLKKIDIQSEPHLSDMLGVPKKLINITEKAGYQTIESLADAPVARLMQETNLKLREAAKLINSARGHLGKIGK